MRCHVCDRLKMESSAVFCLSRIRKILNSRIFDTMQNDHLCEFTNKDCCVLLKGLFCGGVAVWTSLHWRDILDIKRHLNPSWIFHQIFSTAVALVVITVWGVSTPFTQHLFCYNYLVLFYIYLFLFFEYFHNISHISS